MNQSTEDRILAEAYDLAETGRFDSALRRLETVLETDPGHTEAILTKGTVFELMGRADDAIAFYTERLADDSDAAVAIRRGDIFASMNEYEQALRDYDTAIELAPDDPTPWIRKGDALIAMGVPEESAVAFERAIERDPDSFSEFDWDLRGDMLFEAGENEIAADFYGRSTDYRSLWNIGLIKKNAGHHEEALDAFQQALALEPDDVAIINDAGIALLDLDRPADALSYFDDVAELAPGDSYGWINKGIALGRLGRHEEAIEALNRAAELDPLNPDVWVELGYNSEMVGDLEAAIRQYKRATEIDESHSGAWNSLGYVDLTEGRPAEALHSFKQAIENEPEWAAPWANKIRALADLGRSNEALDLVEAALDSVGSRSDVISAHLDVLSDHLYRHGEALTVLRAALEDNPDDAYLGLYLPELLIKTDQFEEARRAGDRLLEGDLTPSNECVMAFLLYIAIGRGAGSEAERLESFRTFIDVYRSGFVEMSRRVEWVFNGLIHWLWHADLDEDERFLLLTLTDMQAGYVDVQRNSYLLGEDAQI